MIEELRFDPRVQFEHIGVSVNAGIVTLSGHAASMAEKCAATLAARRIKGVGAVVDEMEVLFPEDKRTADDDIAYRVVTALRLDTMLPTTIKVTVRHGLVMLSGEVEWFYQRVAAEENIHKLAGVKGVINKIVITPSVTRSDVKNEIERALMRRAEVEADDIKVRIQDSGHVVLEGEIKCWNERSAIEQAAWAAPGVRSVDNRLTINVRRLVPA